MSEVTFYEYDLETIKEGFNKWLDKWKESVIDEEFNDPHERGTVQKIEDDNSLKFKFITEFNFSITKMSEDEVEWLKKWIKGVRNPTDTQPDIHMRSIQGFRIYPEGIMSHSIRWWIICCQRG